MSTYDFTNLTENQIREIAVAVSDALSYMNTCILGREYVIAVQCDENDDSIIEWLKSCQSRCKMRFMDYDATPRHDKEEYIRLKAIDSFKRFWVDYDNDAGECYEFYKFQYNGNTYVSPDAFAFSRLIDDAF